MYRKNVALEKENRLLKVELYARRKRSAVSADPALLDSPAGGSLQVRLDCKSKNPLLNIWDRKADLDFHAWEGLQNMQ